MRTHWPKRLLLTACTALAMSAAVVPPSAVALAAASHLATVVKISASAGTPNSPATTSVTFVAWVNPNGYPTSYCFDYGLTGKYDTINLEADPQWKEGETPYQFLPGTNSPIEVISHVYGLKPGLTYHYRIVVTGDGTVTSRDRTFKTKK